MRFLVILFATIFGLLLAAALYLYLNGYKNETLIALGVSVPFAALALTSLYTSNYNPPITAASPQEQTFGQTHIPTTTSLMDLFQPSLAEPIESVEQNTHVPSTSPEPSVPVNLKSTTITTADTLPSNNTEYQSTIHRSAEPQYTLDKAITRNEYENFEFSRIDNDEEFEAWIAKRVDNFKHYARKELELRDDCDTKTKQLIDEQQLGMLDDLKRECAAKLAELQEQQQRDNAFTF